MGKLQEIIRRLVEDVEKIKCILRDIANKGCESNQDAILSIEAGENITIDNTNPYRPIINSTGGSTVPNHNFLGGIDGGDPVNKIYFHLTKAEHIGLSNKVISITSGDDISVDSTDPQNPIISYNGIKPTGLEALDEGNGIGWRLIGKDPIKFGPIGLNAIDISHSTITGETVGALAPYSFNQGLNNKMPITYGYSSIFGLNNEYLTGASNNGWSFMAGEDNKARGGNSATFGWKNISSGHSSGNNVTLVTGARNNVAIVSGLVAGSALIGKSLSSTVLGQANLDFDGTTYSPINDVTGSLLTVGNGTIDANFIALVRSDAFKILFSGLITAPSLSISMISAGPNRTLVTKEYLASEIAGAGGGGDCCGLNATTLISNTSEQNIIVKGDSSPLSSTLSGYNLSLKDSNNPSRITSYGNEGIYQTNLGNEVTLSFLENIAGEYPRGTFYFPQLSTSAEKRYLPMSVNNVVADLNGNITLPIPEPAECCTLDEVTLKGSFSNRNIEIRREFNPFLLSLGNTELSFIDSDNPNIVTTYGRQLFTQVNDLDILEIQYTDGNPLNEAKGIFRYPRLDDNTTFRVLPISVNNVTAGLDGNITLPIPTSGVQSVVAGANVTVDNTDPANPIVSSTGGGGGTGLVYTAGGGMLLSGAEFSVPVVVTGSGSYVQSVVQSPNAITVTLGTPPNTNTTYSAGSGLGLAGTVFSNTAPNANHTGEVTGATALTITPKAVTFPKIQDILGGKLLGRRSGVAGEVEEITIGGNLSLNAAGILSSTDTNTEYTAGDGLTLTGTTFTLPVTIVGTGSFVTSVVRTSTGLTINLGTPPNTNTTYSAGNGLTLSGTTFTLPVTLTGSGDYVKSVVQTTNGITVDLGTLPSASTPYTGGTNVTVSGSNVISAIDTKYTAGTNVTISGSNVISATDTNTTYSAGTNVTMAGTVISATDTKYTAGANVAISGANVISATDTNTVYTAGANVAISGANVISATDTNTTYSAGAGLSLSGTSFSLPVTVVGTGTYVQSVEQTATGITITLGTPPNTGDTTYTAGDGLTLAGTVFSLPITTSGSGTYVTSITRTSGGLTINLGTPPDNNTTYTAGTNVTISGSNVISATDTKYNLAPYALDANVVHKTGNETVNGLKTFIQPEGIVTEGYNFINSNSRLAVSSDVRNWYVTGKKFSVLAQDTNATSINFSSDGTNMYIVGSTSDRVHQYTLSTAWDIETATIFSNFSVAVQDATPSDLHFSPDGTRMYMIGTTSRAINQYNLSTPWVVTTASYIGRFLVGQGETGPSGLIFSPDGLKAFVVGTTIDTVLEYNLSTAFEVSSCSFSKSFFVGTWELTPSSISFNGDGTRMYVLGNTGFDITEFRLTTAYDIDTASHFSEGFTFTFDAGLQGMFVANGINKAFVVGTSTDFVYELGIDEQLKYFGDSFTMDSQMYVGGRVELRDQLYVNGLIRTLSTLQTGSSITCGRNLTASGSIVSNLSTLDVPIDGLAAVGVSSATLAIPVKRSPRIRLTSQVWDTSVNATRAHNWSMEVIPESGTAPESHLLLSSWAHTDLPAERLKITDHGMLLANAFVTNGGTSNQFVKGDGTLDSNVYLTSGDVYSLPTASTSVKGGIRVGTNLSMSGEILSASDTKYTAGNGLNLSGTVFTSTVAQGTPGSVVTGITQTSTGILVDKGILQTQDIMYNGSSTTTATLPIAYYTLFTYSFPLDLRSSSYLFTGNASFDVEIDGSKNFGTFRFSMAGMSDLTVDLIRPSGGGLGLKKITINIAYTINFSGSTSIQFSGVITYGFEGEIQNSVLIPAAVLSYTGTGTKSISFSFINANSFAGKTIIVHRNHLLQHYWYTT